MTTKLFLLCLPLFACFLPCNCHCKAINNDAGGEIKGMFVFGSSLVDNGNNNFLQTKAKADYLPYGIDFPNGPPGRFSNGKNIIDLLGDQLKLPLIPPFLDPSTKGKKIVHGINYASGGSGILDDTGSILGNVISLNSQIKNFENVTLPEFEAQLGCKPSDLSSKYLFVVGAGGNDYSFNYFNRGLQALVSVESFAANLTKSLSLQLKKLYSLGARKFVLTSLYPTGCIPRVKSSMPVNQGCMETLNRPIQLYNSRLKWLVDAIKPQMPGSNLVVINSYEIISNIIRFHNLKGFKDKDTACCEVIASLNSGENGVFCKRGGKVCAERNNHVFFDGLHPTEAVNLQIATKAFSSSNKNEVYPINVRELAKL